MSAPPPTPWYAEWFEHDYLMVYGHRDARDARLGIDLLLRTLALTRADRILDLACGPGRHAVPLHESGQKVFGLDLSPVLLAEARAAAPTLPLVRADMRRLPFPGGVFAVVTSFFTSFGYFDDDGNAAVLAEVSRVLGTEGRFLLDYLNREPTLRGLRPEASRRLGSTYVLEARSYDHESGRLNKRIEIQEGSETRIRTESVRLYRPDELTAMLSASGLEPEQSWGDLEGSPFDPQRSPRLVVLARRR